jgi:hypothetical protein
MVAEWIVFNRRYLFDRDQIVPLPCIFRFVIALRMPPVRRSGRNVNLLLREPLALRGRATWDQKEVHISFHTARPEFTIDTNVQLHNVQQRRSDMARPIYKNFMFKPTEAWYQLPEEERKKVKAQLAQALKKVGGKEVVMCFSGWDSEQYLGWGVEQFPNIEAVQKHHALLVELNWFRYFDSNSYLGSEVPKA